MLQGRSRSGSCRTPGEPRGETRVMFMSRSVLMSVVSSSLWFHTLSAAYVCVSLTSWINHLLSLFFPGISDSVAAVFLWHFVTEVIRRLWMMVGCVPVQKGNASGCHFEYYFYWNVTVLYHDNKITSYVCKCLYFVCKTATCSLYKTWQSY